MADTIDILLRFLFGSEGADKVQRDVAAVGKSFDGMFPGDKLGADFQRFQADLDETKRKAEEAKRALDYEKVLRRNQIEINRTTQQFYKLHRAATFLTDIGRMMMVGGTAIVGGIFGLAALYVKDAEEATLVTIQWKAATDSLKQSQERVGAVMAEVALPQLRKAAEIVERLATFAEQRPEMVAAAMEIGEILLVGGAIVTAVGKGIRLYADVQYIASVAAQTTAANIMAGAAATQLTAANIMAASAGVSTAGIGARGITAGAAAGGGILGGLQTGLLAAFVAWFATDVIPRITGLFTLTAEQYAEKYNVLTDEKLAQLFGPGVTAPRADFAAENVQLWANYTDQVNALTTSHQQEMIELEDNYWRKRIDLSTKFAEQIQLAEDRFWKSWYRAVQDFQQNEADAEQDYYASRTERAKDFSIAIQRSEEDHQRKMRRMAEAHGDRVEDLLAARDALGLKIEQRRYERDRRDAEEEYLSASRQRAADYADQIMQMEYNFRLQRDRRRRDFFEQMDERAQDHAEQMALMRKNQEETLEQLAKNYEEQSAKLEQNYNEHLNTLETALKARIRAVDAYALGDYAAFQSHMANMAVQFRAWLAGVAGGMTAEGRISTLTTPEMRDTGGYMWPGLYRNTSGVPEFVLRGDTTRYAEKVIGGGLTQSNIASALSGGSYVDNRKIYFSGVTEADRAWIRRDIRVITEEAIVEAMR